VDCLVVDEASMVDLPLMARLLAALPSAARLVLLGDRDQLASVEAGNVLGDITGRGEPIRYGAEQLALLAELGAAPLPALIAAAGAAHTAAEPPPAAAAVALLRKSWRFGANSGIGALARAVNTGDGEAAVALLAAGARTDLARLLPVAEALNPDCIAWAADKFAQVPDADSPDLALKLLERARVLAALHRGRFGVEALNARITARLVELGKADGGDAYHGLPIMVTANDYEVDLYNGDVGLLWRGADGRLAAHFRAPDGSLRSLSVRQLPPHVPAYALTVHKSQGSEFDRVLLVLPPDPHPLVSRELIYTGVTRARRHVTVHATDAVLHHACRARVKRGSALAERLGWGA
jgi:exodeoxyribonuclease V alpha subunit